MKKTAAMILAAAMMVTSLAGCQSKTAETAAETKAESAAETETEASKAEESGAAEAESQTAGEKGTISAPIFSSKERLVIFRAFLTEMAPAITLQRRKTKSKSSTDFPGLRKMLVKDRFRKFINSPRISLCFYILFRFSFRYNNR